MVESISVIVLAKNSEKYLQQCLDSLREFGEVVLLDNGSTDRTLEIASHFANVKIRKHEFIGFGPLRNLAIETTVNDWVLAVDSDEIITAELLNEIKSLKLDKTKVYSIPRDNHYNGHPVRCCGWSPDRVLRLFNKQVTTYDNQLVHESIKIVPGISISALKNALNHYPFDSVSELIDKIQSYSSLYAEQYKGKKKSSPLKAWLRSGFAFFSNYFLQKGFLYGATGLLLAVSSATVVFYKYMKLYEENKR